MDLFKVQGSGAKGRVHKEDVEIFNYEKRIHISPLAAKIAADYGIDLENVTGSGHNGKIMRDDIMKLIGKSQETQEPVKKEEVARKMRKKVFCTIMVRRVLVALISMRGRVRF